MISRQQKEKERFLLIGTPGYLLAIVQYILTNRLAGVAAFLIGFIRGVVFYYYNKKNLKPSVTWLIAFQIAIVSSVIITWQDWTSAIPLIATTTNTWGLWQNNMKYNRLTGLLAPICWFIYNLSAGMYTAAINPGINSVSTAIAIWRLDIKKRAKHDGSIISRNN